MSLFPRSASFTAIRLPRKDRSLPCLGRERRAAWKMVPLLVVFMVLGLKKSLSKGPVGLVLLPTIPFPLSKTLSLAVPFPSRDAGPCNPRPLVSHLGVPGPATPECSGRKSRGKYLEDLALIFAKYATIFNP